MSKPRKLLRAAAIVAVSVAIVRYLGMRFAGDDGSWAKWVPAFAIVLCVDAASIIRAK